MARMDRYKRGNQQPVLRAAYPPDEKPVFTPRYADDLTLYPDNAEEENLYPDAFGEPVYEDEELYEEYVPSPVPTVQTQTYHYKKQKSGLWTLIAFVCVVCLVAMGYYVYYLRKPYQTFQEKANQVMDETFAQGVIVDNVHIGGMTKEQARQVLISSAGYDRQQLQIRLEVEGFHWVLTEAQLPVERNIDAKLEEAYAIGRVGASESIGSGITPMEYKYQHRQHTRNNAAYLYTSVTYDAAKVRELVQIVVNTVNRPAVDAQVATFDFTNRAFTYTEDVMGLRLDENVLFQALIDTLDRQDYGATIRVEAEKIMPQMTRVELMNSFSLISSYTTETTNDKNRNTNVDLAARAVMGTVVMPGEEFSFNQTTGQRTTEKGYLPAAAIAGGTTVDEVGGGVCQVSSTLFNAAVMADMTIIKRSAHTWPSNYVDKGRDATVNWPNLDFVFRNDRTTPIFIVSYYQNRKCTVEIYGASLGHGEGRDIVSQVIDVTEPPAEPIRNYNPELLYGTEKEVKKARTGYVVDTYKIYTRNGQEYKREKLDQSVYRMIQQQIDYNY